MKWPWHKVNHHDDVETRLADVEQQMLEMARRVRILELEAGIIKSVTDGGDE